MQEGLLGEGGWGKYIGGCPAPELRSKQTHKEAYTHKLTRTQGTVEKRKHTRTTSIT